MLGGVPTAFRPLRHSDFRLLWTRLAISLVGSGLWLVALAWQVIELGGGPTELSLVTALFSVGLLAFVLIGGVAADGLPQRLVMLAADLIRTAVLLVLGLLSLSGELRGLHGDRWPGRRGLRSNGGLCPRPDQRRYGAPSGRTHHERTYEKDEDNRC